MILNNTTNSSQEWIVSNEENNVRGVKGRESWGTIVPPAGPFNYTVKFGSYTAENVDNPDACATVTDSGLLITYPGA